MIILASLLLISLTSCKTVEKIYVYPTFIEPSIPEPPQREEWHFTAIDADSFIISEQGLKNVITYILDLREHIEIQAEWLDYYITETGKYTE